MVLLAAKRVISPARDAMVRIIEEASMPGSHTDGSAPSPVGLGPPRAGGSGLSPHESAVRRSSRWRWCSRCC